MRSQAMPRILLAALALAMVSVAPVMAAKTTFEGVLQSTSGHDGTTWAVELANHTVIKLPSAPVSDYSNSTVPPLTRVRVTCTLSAWRAGGLVADCTDLSPVTVLSTPDASSAAYKITAFTGEKTTGVKFAFTMAVADMSKCGHPQPVTVSEVQNVLSTVGRIINGCSFGSMSIDTSKIKVVPVTFDCAAATTALTSCDDTALRALALQALNYPQSQVGVQHIGVVLPNGANCVWAALAEIGAPFTWYQPMDYGVRRASTIIQELLHNFGLYHSSKDNGVCTCEGQDNCRCHVEYGDNSTPMGTGDGCLTAPEMYRLNWATAIASLDSLSLQPGAPQTYTLPGTLTATANMVIVKPNWVQPYTKNLYFALRTSAGEDTALAAEFVGKVSLHSTDQAVDATNSDVNLKSHILTTIAPSTQAFEVTGYKLLVSTGALTGSSISLTLCRYDISKSECSGSGSAGSPPMPSPPMPGSAMPSPPMPSPGPAGCQDQNTDCSYWQQQGYCDSNSVYSAFMNDNCKAACGLCSGCKDNDDACSDLVATVGCSGNNPYAQYAATQCPKSCNTCSSSTSAATAAAGQRCVDLSSSCATFKQLLTCNPSSANATLWMNVNCQATCELCPVTSSAASLADQPPLGCALGHDVVGAKTLNVTSAPDLASCWQKCFDADGCYLLTYISKNQTCVLRTTLAEAAANSKYAIVQDASRTVCVVGTDVDSKAPELRTWFYCVDNLDISGTFVSVPAVTGQMACAKACNASATCAFFVLLNDGSCVLKADTFGGDMGTNGANSAVDQACIQTFYTTPQSSNSSRRRALVSVAGQEPAITLPRRLSTTRQALGSLPAAA